MTNIKRWKKEEENFLRENYKNISNVDLAEKFGVTVIAIQRKLSRLGCIRQKQKKWTSVEEEFLRKNFMKMSDEEISRHFDVTPISIRRKLHRLGLSRLQEKKKNMRKTQLRKKIMGRVTRKRKQKKENYADIYKITKEYKEFDKIYHEVWRKEGTVKRVLTDQGMKYIIVEFEELGEKKLVMGMEV
ncbi:MAG: hypothetical protein ACQESP_01590 [Candidatus Muiribacteriota bacterium]